MSRVVGGSGSVWGIAAVAVVASLTWLGGAGAPADTVLAVPGRANSNPSLAAVGSFVTAAWAVGRESGGTDVYLAASVDAGKSFGTPVRLSGPAGADVSGEQPPRVVLSPRVGRAPAIVVVWTSKAASGTQLLTTRSEDGGRHFSPPLLVPGSDAPGNRGWESAAVTPAGDVFAAWLDHREMATGTAGATHGAHQHGAGAADADGAARAQQSKLFFGPVSGEGGRALAGGVCYCCKTALAAGPGGRFYAAWRHVYPGNIRDIAFTMSSDGGRTFAPHVRVSEDRWAIDGCPENGPALAVDARQRVHIVWPTVVPAADVSREPTLELFHAMSADGRRFTPRQRIPTGPVARHPQLVIDASGDFFVVWDEPAGGRSRIATARGRVDANGAATFVRRTLEDPASATYPAVALTSEGPVVAWSSRAEATPSVIRVSPLRF